MQVIGCHREVEIIIIIHQLVPDSRLTVTTAPVVLTKSHNDVK